MLLGAHVLVDQAEVPPRQGPELRIGGLDLGQRQAVRAGDRAEAVAAPHHVRARDVRLHQHHDQRLAWAGARPHHAPELVQLVGQGARRGVDDGDQDEWGRRLVGDGIGLPATRRACHQPEKQDRQQPFHGPSIAPSVNAPTLALTR